MSYCRNCGAQTHAALCWGCIKRVSQNCDSATQVLALMEDEIGKETCKAGIGAASDGAKSVISYAALEARDTLVKNVKELQARADIPKTGKPTDLKAQVRFLQSGFNGADVDDPLNFLVPQFLGAVRDCWRMVDTREERVSAGMCACGTHLQAFTNQEVIKCPACGEQIQVGVAVERQREYIDAGLNNAWLKDDLMVLAVNTRTEYRTTVSTIKSWVRRRKLQRDEQGRTFFNDVLFLLESS